MVSDCLSHLESRAVCYCFACTVTELLQELEGTTEELPADAIRLSLYAQQTIVANDRARLYNGADDSGQEQSFQIAAVTAGSSSLMTLYIVRYI